MSIKLMNNKLQSGFTLVELMFVITTLVILATLGYPSFMKSLCNNEAKSIKNIIYNTLRNAKTTSYINHRHVFLCLADDTMNCDKNATKNLILFFDNNGNNQFDKATDSLLLSESLNLKYASVRLATGGRRKYVRFSEDTGTPRGFMGHIKYCPFHIYNANKYQISFNMVGLIRFKPDSAKNPTGC